MRTVEDHLVAGVGVDGGHDAAHDGSELVEGVRHGGEAVGGAGRRGNDGVVLGQSLFVDAVHDGGQVVAGGSGNDDFLRACVDVRLRLRLGGVETGAFEHDVHADFFPGQISRILFGIDLDLFAVHDDRAVFGFDFVREGVSALRTVVLEKVGEHFRVGEVVDGDHLVSFRGEHLTESQTADSAEAVDSNSNVLCHNYESSERLFTKGVQSEQSFRTCYILHLMNKKHKRFTRQNSAGGRACAPENSVRACARCRQNGGKEPFAAAAA